MVRFIRLVAREVIYTLALVIGVTAILYVCLNIMPGAFPGKGTGVLGFLDLLRGLFSFHFGSSSVTGLDINGIVFPAFKNTLLLTIGSMVISTCIAIPIGIFSAFKSFTGYAWPLSIFSYIISSIPVFYFGYLVLYLVSRYTGYLPIFYPRPRVGENRMLSYILPILVLGLGNDSISEIVRLITNELGRVMATDYVVASRARGETVLGSSVNEGIIIPYVSIIFSKIPLLIGGAVIVEHVFNWPGMGRLAFQATLDRDMPLLVAIAFLAVLFVRAGHILKSVILFQLNPGEK